MGIFDEYLEKAKDLAEDARDGAKDVFGEVASRAKEVAGEGSEARKIVQSAKERKGAVSSCCNRSKRESSGDDPGC